MSDRLSATIALYGLFLAGWALLPLLAGARPGQTFGAATVLFELALILQAAVATAAWIGGERPDEPAVFAGYLAVSVGLLPAASRLGSEPTAWDAAIVAIACVALAVVSWRMSLTW